MQIIEGISDQPKQQITVSLAGGTSFDLTLYFKPQQSGWFFDLAWNGSPVCNGQRLVASPNALRQYINLIPFGIMVLTQGNVEPTGIEDFSDGTAQLVLLQGSDIPLVESTAFGAPPQPVQAVATRANGSQVIIPPSQWGPATGDLSGDYPGPNVVAVHEGGGQQLTIAAITDGQFLKRSGSSIISAPSAGGTGAVVAVATSWATMKAQMWLLGTTPSTDGDLVALLGYNYRDDGGGGMFEWNGASSVGDDGGTIMKFTSVGTGRLFRYGAGTYQTAYIQATTLDIRWFGGIAGNNGPDNAGALNRAIAAILNSLTYQCGTVYFPAGYYAFNTPVAINCNASGGNGAITLKGDGQATQLVSNMTHPLPMGTNAFIEMYGGTSCGLQDLSLLYAAGDNPPSALYFHDSSYGVLSNVQIQGFTGTGMAGAGIRAEANTMLQVKNCIVKGSGLAMLWHGGSGKVSGNAFYTDTANPAVWVNSANSLTAVDNFLQGGGPWSSFPGAALTGAGSSVTIAAAGHTFVAGDYAVITNATHTAYNGIWKIASVVAGVSVTITTTYTTTDSVTLSSQSSSLLIQCVGGGTTVTESFFGELFINSPAGGKAIGSVGILVDGFHGGAVGELSFSDCLCDYGFTAIHCYGSLTSAGSPTQYNSTCQGITIANVRPNGGPCDSFGGIRLEACVGVSVDNPRMHPGNNSPPGTGATFYSVVITDGGQTTGRCQDISVTGGILTYPLSSAQYSSATIVAVVLQGANVYNVSIVNCGVDATSGNAAVMALQATGTGTAALANGITMLYANNAGRLTLIDSTRAIPGGNL